MCDLQNTLTVTVSVHFTCALRDQSLTYAQFLGGIWTVSNDVLDGSPLEAEEKQGLEWEGDTSQSSHPFSQ